MNVFVRNLEGGEEQRVSSSKDRDLAGFSWKGNDFILYVRDFGGDENYHIFSVNLKTGKETDLTPFERTRARIIDTLEYVNDDEMIISHNKRDAKVFDVYRLNLKTGKSKMIFQNPGDIEGYLTDHLGQLRIAGRSVGVDSEVLYRENEKAPFKVIMKYDYTQTFRPVLFTPDNKRLYTISNLGRDKETLVEFDPATKKEVRMIYQNPEYDISNWGSPLSYSKKRKKLLAVDYVTWKLQHAFFDAEYEAMYNALTDQFPNANIDVVSRSKNEDKYTLSVSSDRMRGKYYLYDAKTKRLELLADIAPWLNENEMAEMKPVQYTARDGLVIHAYLTLPKGKEPKNLPIVINPHGGPWARDVWRFNSETQFLANRGYGVLQMNFRGSTGYGRRHLVSSYKQWGLKMQDDVTDAAQWLIDMGIANKKKICIYGGSYGGYTTLMGLVKTPDLYACGVNYVGVANLFTFMKTIPPYWENWREKMYAMIGNPEKDEAQFKLTSPVYNVDKIKAPLLIVQGAKDPRVKKDESDQMVAALKKRGVNVPYLLKEDEGHGFRNEENRFEFYTQMESFLGKYLN